MEPFAGRVLVNNGTAARDILLEAILFWDIAVVEMLQMGDTFL